MLGASQTLKALQLLAESFPKKFSLFLQSRTANSRSTRAAVGPAGRRRDGRTAALPSGPQSVCSLSVCLSISLAPSTKVLASLIHFSRATPPSRSRDHRDHRDLEAVVARSVGAGCARPSGPRAGANCLSTVCPLRSVPPAAVGPTVCLQSVCLPACPPRSLLVPHSLRATHATLTFSSSAMQSLSLTARLPRSLLVPGSLPATIASLAQSRSLIQRKSLLSSSYRVPPLASLILFSRAETPLSP